jgi:hypothetical protein
MNMFHRQTPTKVGQCKCDIADAKRHMWVLSGKPDPVPSMTARLLSPPARGDSDGGKFSRTYTPQTIDQPREEESRFDTRSVKAAKRCTRCTRSPEESVIAKTAMQAHS